jgi:hypothetical protein
MKSRIMDNRQAEELRLERLKKEGSDEYRKHLLMNFRISVIAFLIIPPAITWMMSKLGIGCGWCAVIYGVASIALVFPLVIARKRYVEWKKIAIENYVKEHSLMKKVK